MKKTLVIFSLLFVLVINETDVLKCGEEKIENCVECGEGEASNTCAKCKDNYFLFFHNLYCVACNNAIYGQVGCAGNCDGSRFSTDRFAYCNKDDCDEGYYNLQGICFRCADGSPGCKKCTISAVEDENGEEKNKTYICEECLNNEYRLDKQYGVCVHCRRTSPSYCSKCHYDENINNICDQCHSGFYLSNNSCKKCHNPVNITHGKCSVCSDDETDYDSGPCWCDSYYTQSTHSTCVSCPDNCPYCVYNKDTLKTECLRCDPGFAVNSQKTCTSCGEGCEYCFLNEDSEPVCSFCFSRTFLSEDKKCLVCPNNCTRCQLDENDQIKCVECRDEFTLNKEGECISCPDGCKSCYIKDNNEIGCKKCFNGYSLNGEEECVACSKITEIGGDACKTCGYNKEKNQYECYQCKSLENDHDYYKKEVYTYVTNTFQCFDNTDPKNQSFYGCIRSFYNEVTDKYECLKCSSYNSFIPIKNEKICKKYKDANLQSYCLEAENIGTKETPIYSCTNCPIYRTKVKKPGNIIDCYAREYEYSYCLEGEVYENYTKTCTKCVPNSHFNSSNYCQCDSDSFGRYKAWWCHKCDDKSYGNPGCESSKGCVFYSSNDQLNCNQCKNDYFTYTEGQCFSCQLEIDHCNECHFDNKNQKLLCDKCDEDYFYNETEKKCVLNDCQEYPEVAPGCIICKEHLEEYKSKKICHSCNHGYFKTKENTCVYCRSEKYGGPDCLKCGYDDETQNIQCKYCPMDSHLLTYDGKCYNCKNYLSDNCQVCNFEKDELKCSLCSPGYYLNYKGECISYLNYIKSISNCREYYYNISNITFALYSSSYYSSLDSIVYYNYSYYCIYEYYNNSNNDYYRYNYGTYSLPYDYINRYFYIYDDNYNYDRYNYYYYNKYLFRKNYSNIVDNIKIPEINSEIEAKCIVCENGYNINDYGNCAPLKDKDCSILSIIQNFPERYQDCRRLCNYNDYAYLHFLIKNNTINNDYNEEQINNILLYFEEIFSGYYYDYYGEHSVFYNYYPRFNDYYYNKYFNPYHFFWTKNLSDLFTIYGNDLKYLFIQNEMCVNTSLYTENLKNCKDVSYIIENNTYECIRCDYDYYFDNITHSCVYKYNNNYENEYNYENNENLIVLDGTNYCYSENKGSESNPIYSCKKCYNKNNVLVTTENDINYCENPKNGLDNCLEANVNTTYINPLYNCTSCSFNYLPYYSEFFERKICQNIYEDITTEIEISLEPFKEIENATAKDGKCEKNNYFTPDGEYCYPCSNEIVGMPGCKGACTFSLKRKQNIKCEGECEDEGYIESSEGVCESCSSINKGCAKCHYEKEYPADYIGIKRSRRFVCDVCESDFIMSKGKCLRCSDVGLDNCAQCEIDDQNKNNFKCKKCEEGYVLKENKCYSCDKYLTEFFQNDKCYSCSDVINGGVTGCSQCEKNDNKVICHKCYDSSFILLENNNTCLNRTQNNELKKFEFCEVLSLDDNNELYCSKCKSQYSLLKENSKQKCEYIPLLYDYNYYNYINYFREYYYSSYYSPYYYGSYYDIYDYYYGAYYHFYNRYYYYHFYEYDEYRYRDEEYNYYNNYKLYPCQEASNIGTKENPVFTCNKCYQYVDNDNLYIYSPYTRIINEINNINYCIKPGKELFNCTEAINKTENGIEKYDCIKCAKDNNLIYNGDLDIHYCQYVNKASKCVVKFCRSCKDHDNYFCSVCLLSDYEVNKLTGACVKKAEIVPAITWKDIFRLQLNSNKVINGRTYYGPSLNLRGIASSQINSRHAFLIYLTFKLRTRTRNLEETEKKIPTLCETLNSLDETKDDVNIVDYECIGNTTGDQNLNDYVLNNIEEGDNEGMLKESNLLDIVKQTDLEDLINKNEPSFGLNDLMRIVTFEMNEVKDQLSKNLKFDFTIDGKINKELKPQNINAKLKMLEIEEEADCSFNIEENKIANLNCKINLEKYKDKQSFAFKTSEINTEENDIYLAKLSDISLINEQEKKKDYTVVIVVCIVGGVLLISGATVLTYVLIRRRKLNKLNNNTDNSEKKEIGAKNDNGNKVIKFDNNENNKNNEQEGPKTVDELK